MRKYRLNTRINTLSLKELRDVCGFGIGFCSVEIGNNNRHSSPISYSIRTTKSKKKTLGEYCFKTNKIIIYRHNMITLGDFIKVFIHEYTHYLQPIKTKYHKMLDECGYENHPHEIEAENNASMYYDKFMKEYRNSLK